MTFVNSSEDTNVHPILVDLDLFVETVKYIRKLMMTGPLAEFHQEFCQPGPEVESDDQIKEWVSKYSEPKTYLALTLRR